MSTSYEAWARYDVDKELERVDVVEQHEQQHKHKQKKVAEKRDVENSISRDAEQSAEVLAAHAAVAALKAKKGRVKGRSPAIVEAASQQQSPPQDQSDGDKETAKRIDAETLARLAEGMKQKHALIKTIMEARRHADELMKESVKDYDASLVEYERALASAKTLETLTPQLQQLQKDQALILRKHPMIDETKSDQQHHHDGNQCEKEPHSGDHNYDHSHDHDHGSDCHGCESSGASKTKKKTAPTTTESPLPKVDDLDAVVKMFLKDCYLGIGACAMGKRHLAAASEAFKEVLLRDNSHLWAWLQRGKCFESMDAPLLAWLHYNRVTSLDAKFEDAQACEDRIKSVLLQQSATSQQDTSDVVETKSLKELLIQVKLHMDAGNIIMIESFGEYAVQKYEHALRLLTVARGRELQSPTNPTVTKVLSQLEITCHVNIASCCLEMQKQYASALHHCQLALEIDPGHIIATFRMGQVYRATHGYELALGAFHTVRMLLAYLPAEKAQEQRMKLDKEVDKCTYERSQYDAAFIRQQLQQDTFSER